MATRIMVIWILVLLVGWASVFGFFYQYFDGAELERMHVAQLQKQVHRSHRQIAKLELKFDEFKDAIAEAGVKIQDNRGWTDPKRMIASVMADPEFKKIPQLQPGGSAFTEARKIFATGDYVRATDLLEDFFQKYPDSPNLPEAGYLLSESYFSLNQLEASAKMIDFVVTHFPETEFACYGLVRLGKIFEKEERIDEASDIYKLAIPQFPNSNCEALAKKNLKEINL